MKSPIKAAIYVALVFVVGLAGVFAGHFIRSRVTRDSVKYVTATVPTSLLKRGDLLPDVSLVGTTDSQERVGDVVGGDGAVLLFLDLECPPCTDMCRRWQRAIDDGWIDRDQVIGIAYHSPEIIRRYAEDHDIRFALYQDPEQVFRNEYDVDRFPLEVVVGESGRIRATSYDSSSPIDLEQLLDHLAD